MSEKVYMFSSAHRQRLSNRLGQRTIRSQVSVIFILLLSQKKNEDRQWQTDTRKLPVQKADKTSQIRMTTWKRKQNTSHSNSERNELRKRDGVGWEGAEGEKKNELVTTKWLILRQRREKTNNICHYKIATEKVE